MELWVGHGTPCTPHDRDNLAAATKITVGDGRKALFWEAAWLNGMRARDLAPLILELSKKKKCMVSKALQNDFWVSQINSLNGLTT
jgi:hypothetical protein